MELVVSQHQNLRVQLVFSRHQNAQGRKEPTEETLRAFALEKLRSSFALLGGRGTLAQEISQIVAANLLDF